jgi:phage terminase large subunit
MQIPTTINYIRLKNADKAGYYNKVLEGSSGSGKTYSILQYLIEKATAKKLRIRACRFDSATCDDSIVADFTKIMQEQFQLWNSRNWNKVEKRYTFDNGSIIRFIGCKDPAKLHGPRFDITWFNEVMEMTYESYRQANQRTSEEFICDFNPSLIHHWVFEKIARQANCKWIHSTFNDNPYLPEEDRAAILSYDPDNPDNVEHGTADEWAWCVYGLGKRGQREGAIFKPLDYEIVDEWPEKMHCKAHGYGLDFGFSHDPTALAEWCLFQNKLYARELIYETGLINTISREQPSKPSIQGRLKDMNFSKSWLIRADCAEPKSIEELCTEGYNVVACEKRQGSIAAGLNLLKRFKLCLHRDSVNAQIEIQQYAWKRHAASGIWLNEPEDRYNHFFDAFRYGSVEDLIRFSHDISHKGKRARVARKKVRY